MSLPMPSTVLHAARPNATAHQPATISSRFLMAFPFPNVGLSSDAADVDEMPFDGGRRSHRGADQVRAPTGALPALEIAVRGGRAALAGLEPIGVHRQAHRAA